MIAAYSTGVPALAISYSVKSIGIARDLLGDAERYAVEWKKIGESCVLRQRFQDLMADEAQLRARYRRVLPEYMATIQVALNRIFSEI